ncbi:MAG: hypothetical protein LUE10_01060 [Alistipes sp.]|nr:hypothetical protein [Alistipes sp.]
MNLNVYKILLLAAGFVLASCSRKEGGDKTPETPETTQAVYLKIDTKK